MKDKYLKWDSVRKWVQIVLNSAVTAYTIFGGEKTIQGVLKHLNAQKCLEYVEKNQWTLMVASILVATVLLILINTWFAKRTEKVLDEASASFNEYHKELSNAFFEMRRWCQDHSDADAELFINVVKAYCDDLCQGINDFFKARYKLNMHVCVKMVDLSFLKEEKKVALKDQRLFTLARGGADVKQRREMERQQIILRTGDYIKEKTPVFPAEPAGEISDFYTMLDANEHPERVDSESGIGFITHDMVRYRNRIVRFNKFNKNNTLGEGYLPIYRRYRTTSGKWWEKYRSTACIPIRVHKTHLDEDAQKKVTSDFLVVGFLCIDAPCRLNKQLMEQLGEYTKGFAKTLEGFFREVVILGLPKIEVEDKPKKKLPEGETEEQIPAQGIVRDSFWRMWMNVVLAFGGPKAVKKLQKKLLVKYANACPDVMKDKDDPFWIYEEKENDNIIETTAANA